MRRQHIRDGDLIARISADKIITINCQVVYNSVFATCVIQDVGSSSKLVRLYMLSKNKHYENKDIEEYYLMSKLDTLNICGQPSMHN